MSATSLTPERDVMCQQLRATLESDQAELTLEDLFALRRDIADQHAAYRLRPLPAGSDTSRAADDIRAARADLLGQVWLHLDTLTRERQGA